MRGVSQTLNLGSGSAQRADGEHRSAGLRRNPGGRCTADLPWDAHLRPPSVASHRGVAEPEPRQPVPWAQDPRSAQTPARNRNTARHSDSAVRVLTWSTVSKVIADRNAPPL